MAISEEELTNLRQNIDILSIIEPHVSLRRAGQDYVGRCPFHQEKTPSFSVSPQKSMFYCFGCHVGGDGFAFVMRHLGLNFVEAAVHIAQSMGITLSHQSDNDPAAQQHLQKLWERGASLQQWFSQCLWGALGGQARQFLQTRRISEQLARRWQLGFAPADANIQTWLTEQGWSKEDLAELGLVSERGQCLLQGRLVFPIFDQHSHVIAFGGRLLNKTEHLAKYINSRHCALFVKQHSLYGIERALPTWRAGQPAILVEGYFDVLACDGARIAGAVAPMGTTFSAEQAQTLRRFCKQVVVLMDGDSAGQRSCLHICTTLLQASLRPLVVSLPNNHDPDSLVREQGAAVLRHYVAQATPAMDQFLAQAFADSSQPISAKITQANLLAPLLLALPAGLERDVYTHRLASNIGIPAEQLLRTLQQHNKQAPHAPASRSPSSGQALQPAKPRSTAPSKTIEAKTEASAATAIWCWLRELLFYPHLRPRLSELSPYLTCPKSRAICMDLAQKEGPIEQILADHLPKDLWRHQPPWQAAPPIGGTGDIAVKAERAFRDTMHFLQRQQINAELQTISQALSLEQAKGDATEQLLRRKRELILQRKALRNGAA